MNYRNPRWNAGGTIDCEIDHPELGWVPFTANPADPQRHGVELYEEIIAAGDIAEYSPPEDTSLQ